MPAWTKNALIAGAVGLGIAALLALIIWAAIADERRTDRIREKHHNDLVTRIQKLCGPEVGQKFELAYPNWGDFNDQAQSEYKKLARKCVNASVD